MNNLKVFWGVTVVALALAVGSNSAQANPLTSPSGSSYTGTIKAEADGATTLDSNASPPFSPVTCTGSSAEGKVETHTETKASGKVSSLNFTGCNFPVTVLKVGTLEVESAGAGTGVVRSTGAEVAIETTRGKCVYTTNNTRIGTLTGSDITGGPATLDLNSSAIPRTAGTFECGSAGIWTGSYKVVTPGALYLDPPAASGNPLTSPEGAAYTSTLKAASSNWALTGAFVTVSCSSSSFEGQVEAHVENRAWGLLSGLTFTGCNFPVAVNKPGSIEVEASGEGKGLVRSSGAEITINTSLGTCVFTTLATTIGTFTGSNLTGGNAVLDLVGNLPRTGGNFLCGSSGTLDGSYGFSMPSPLYLDVSSSPLTAPKGSLYAGSLKAESSTWKLTGAFTTVECNSSFEGKIESHTETKASGNLSSLSFSSCNFAVTVKKVGSIEMESIGEGKAAVLSRNSEFTIETSLGTCVFTTASSGTAVGTLTGTSITSGSAVLDLAGSIPRTSGNFLCGSSGTLEGSYKFTTPSTLYVD